jgi:hypothetical protein
VAIEKSPESRGFSAETPSIAAEPCEYYGETMAKMGNK